MKPYDILAIGELNVDLILNNIDGEPEVGKEKFAGDMILTLGSSTAIFAANAAALKRESGLSGRSPSFSPPLVYSCRMAARLIASLPIPFP